MKLVIANKNYSTWSLRPWLLLSHHNVVFDEVFESLGGDDLTERLRRHSPSARVPVLVHDNLTVWDSLAICEYISEIELEGRGWPGEIRERSQARSISAEMHAGFTALRSEMPMNIRARRTIEPSAAALRDIQRIDEIWSDCRKQAGSRGKWLFGEFSIADCMFAPVALRFMTYGADLSEASRTYMESILEHPGIVKWMTAAKTETEIIPADEAGK